MESFTTKPILCKTCMLIRSSISYNYVDIDKLEGANQYKTYMSW